MDTFSCPHCGGDVPQGMRFCPHCMTTLVQTENVEVKQPGNKKKRYVIAIAACASAVMAVCGYFIFARSSGDDSSAQNKNTDTSVSADVSQTQSSTESLKSRETAASTTTSAAPAETTTSQQITFETQTTSLSPQNKQTLNSTIDPETLAAGINNWCSAHSSKYFGINSAQDIKSEQDADATTLSFTDKSGAFINIGTNKNGNISIYIRISHVSYAANDPHTKEILSALGEVFFGCDLNGRNSTFTENGYSFEILSRNMPELGFSEYSIDAKKS
ncbi:zinc ribbon domain-containing protein [Ruminococcus sp. FC2018]|uniref:zinc ribbon domain-containing protein n=1 Tax=Ruminococcus sp. FC2018 TaxID=1410617 RepID=UPI000491273B|nr:zinc ribbon domain-containing protein [Ruminococcus sp. FC2018]